MWSRRVGEADRTVDPRIPPRPRERAVVRIAAFQGCEREPGRVFPEQPGPLALLDASLDRLKGGTRVP
jgi:hypothetical protein